MAHEIVFMQPLHDYDDRATPLVIEPGVERVVIPLVAGLPLCLGKRLFGLQWVIDQYDVGTAPGEHASSGGSEPVTLPGGNELLHGLAVRRQASRKQPS